MNIFSLSAIGVVILSFVVFFVLKLNSKPKAGPEKIPPNPDYLIPGCPVTTCLRLECPKQRMTYDRNGCPMCPECVK